MQFANHRTPPSRRADAAVFLLALALRTAWVLTLPDDLLWIDEQDFAEIARRIAAGDGYVSSSYRANPILPVYLALFFHIFGDALIYPRLGQAVLGALTCVVLQRLGRGLAGPTVGTIAAILLALYPGHIYLSGAFYVDCIATLLTLGWLLATYRTAQARSPALVGAGAGVLFGLTVLTRPTFLIVMPAAVIAMFMVPGARVRTASAAVAAFLVAGTLTVSPWTARNYATYGRVILVASGFGDTLWKGNNELADGGPHDRFLNSETQRWRLRLAELPRDEQDALNAKYREIERRIHERSREIGDKFLARDDVLGPVAVEFITENPGRFARLFGRKVVTLFDAFSETGVSNAHTVSPLTKAVAVYFYPLLALAVAGAAVTLRDWRRFGPLLLLVAAWVAAHGILTSCTRFRLPIDPILFLFSALILARMLSRMRKSNPS